MKILFLRPKPEIDDAWHKIYQGLEEKGIALLYPEDLKEAWQMLQMHGTSVDLAVFHLEGHYGIEAVLALLEKIKGDPLFSDLPMILTTEEWSDEKCYAHQSGPTGANAYLRWPFEVDELLRVIHSIVGEEPVHQEREASSEFSGVPSAISMQMMDMPEVGSLQNINDSIQSPSEPIETSHESPNEPNVEFSQAETEAMSEEMPYLFSRTPLQQQAEPQPELSPTELPELQGLKDPIRDSLIFAEPLGDAVVPGGAAQPPDLETFKKYLLLREQDVAVLSNQLKAVHDQVSMLEQLLKAERAKNVELTHGLNEQKHKFEESEKEVIAVKEGLQNELNDLHFQVKAKSDRAKIVETQLRDITEEMERLKERVRSDIRKIRVREKELENRLEIVKKDSEALIGARENKIVELKRKLDLMEFNMDLLQDQHSKEKENSTRLKERLVKAAQVVRVASGLLDSGPQSVSQSSSQSSTETSPETAPADTLRYKE